MKKTLLDIKKQFVLGGKIIRLVFEANKKWSSFYFTCMMVTGLIPTAGFYLGKLTIDAILAKNIQQVILYSFAGLGIYTFSSLFNSMAMHGYDVMKDYLTKHAFDKVLSKAASLDLSYFEDAKFHDQLEKVQREIYWRPYQAMGLVVELVSSLAAAISLSLLLINLFWWAPIVLIALSIPRLIYRFKFSYYTYSITDNRSPDNRKISQISWLLTYKDAAAEIRAFNLKDYLIGQFHQLNDKFIKQNRDLSSKQNYLSFGLDFLGNVSYYFLSFLAALQTFANQISLGDLTMLTGTIRQFQNVVQGIIADFARFYEANLFLQHYFEFLDLKPTITNPQNPKIINTNKPVSIEFKNVSFGYDPKKQILKNINLKISDAKNFALVGENGAGKTTLVKLMLRLYDVTEGQILVNGIDIKTIDLQNLRQAIGIVFQDFMHYETTTKENIGFGNINKIDDQKNIEMAAKLSGADEFIQKFKDKYDTMLGKYFEKGEELSGGQWQKIALARAFFKNAPVLILDEPTAALDPKSEFEVFKNLVGHTKDKSLILISHRFSTVRIADEIIVLEKGEIVEQGSHDQLMKMGGQYFKLYSLQAKWYK